ncbi:MAG: hypothetical protein JO332_17920, partial [Planctomycetaceae bacterium]|nr:hypothetical protein [Planctomycetaceae bacterium]
KSYYDDRPAGPDGPWFEGIARVLLGEGPRLDEAAPSRKSQAAFFLGMHALLDGRRDEALGYLKTAAEGEGFDADCARAELQDLQKGSR